MSRTKWILLVIVAVFMVIQVVRPDLTNPPVNPRNAIQNVPPNVQAILQRSCYDCHSSQTRWPWYAQVAPLSWLLKHDVDEGRQELSFSEFATYSPKKAARKMQKACEEVKGGDMPLMQYLPLHPDARLSDADRQTLCTWATAEQQRLVAAR
ncbi:MAG TPA: heme-binding domain-containing protein [Thermoanaerobaculia bacterium]|nr:heme-binding domain-containing protein [Thermoanaerobaculia bacterium]